MIAASLIALAAAPASALTSDAETPSIFSDINFSFAADGAILASAHELSGGVQAMFAADLEWEGISDNGWRWGLELGFQAQNDKARRGFGQSIDVRSTRTERSLVTGRYHGGSEIEQASVFAADAAFVFLRTGKGDLQIGLTEGAAMRETIALPTGAFTARLDGGPLAVSHHSPILANNQTGGLGPALVYSTPRIIGLRASLSYAPNSTICGADICRDSRAVNGVETTLQDVIEFGLSFDHLFRDLGQVEAGLNVTFAQPESSGIFDEFNAIGYGARWSGQAWSVGLAGLWSDNGVNDGDYHATAIAVRRDGEVWSLGAELAASRDDWIDEEARSAQITLSRLLGDHYGVAFGLHWQEREWQRQSSQGIENISESGVGGFFELSFAYR